MGEVVAALEQQHSVSTTKPSPAEERGRKGGGATRQMSKRNWQASNTINFDSLHHHQKRSEGFQTFQRVLPPQHFLTTPPFHPPPSPVPAARQARSWPGTEASKSGSGSRKIPWLPEAKAASQRRVHFPSESAVWHLRGPSGLQASQLFLYKQFWGLTTIFIPALQKAWKANRSQGYTCDYHHQSQQILITQQIARLDLACM